MHEIGLQGARIAGRGMVFPVGTKQCLVCCASRTSIAGYYHCARAIERNSRGSTSSKV